MAYLIILQNENKINYIIKSVKEVIKLKDPTQKIISKWKRPNGMIISKYTVPIGVIGVIGVIRILRDVWLIRFIRVTKFIWVACSGCCHHHSYLHCCHRHS